MVGELIDILNISRKDEGSFTCFASNKMTPTGCAEKVGVDTHNFYVEVQYKATRQRFVASNATLNHMQELQFICDVDSDPPGNISILSSNGTTLQSTAGNKQLRYSKTSSCLEDKGSFTCVTANTHNSGSPESRTITVDVRCSPMYRLNEFPITSVRSSQGEKAVMNFSFYSNPLPTSIVWRNLSSNLKNAIHANDNDRVTIITSEDNMTSVVIVNPVEPGDFCNYSVTADNEVGSKMEIFRILKDDESLATKSASTSSFATIIGSVGASVVLISILLVTFFYRKRKSTNKNNDLDIKNDDSEYEEIRYKELTTLGYTGVMEYSELDFQRKLEETEQRTTPAENETYENLQLFTCRTKILSTS
ncbi:uncharacterized protein LOC128235392 isoform X1 [Mya arenaria]|uniref:uncharacterized protein LOC128235392 isoform X1 n=2 Tax=Mya arenaria TaxID=6604 RepID=UPI0022E775E1|nr:uncharacterized protein LOC128235392 isoform X1 [Mya arenaria]